MVALYERRLTPQERYIRKAEQLLRARDRLTDTQARELLTILDGVRAELMDDLSRIPVEADTWSAHWLRQLRAQIDEAAQQIIDRAGKNVRDGQTAAFGAGAEFAPLSFGEAGVQLGSGLPTLGVSTQQLQVAHQLAADLVTKVSREFQQRAKREVTLATVGAKSPWQAQLAIRDFLRTQPDRQTKQMGTIASQAERIVRTELMSAFSLANDMRSAQIADAVPGLRKWWRAADDPRTRPEHRAAMRRYEPGGDPGPIPVADDFIVAGERMRGPHDPRGGASNVVNCRCVRLDWHPDWGT